MIFKPPIFKPPHAAHIEHQREQRPSKEMRLRCVIATLSGLLLCTKSGFAQQDFMKNVENGLLGVEDCCRHVEDLELRLNATEDELRTQRAAVDRLKAENHDMQEKLNVTEEQIEQLTQKLDAPRVAFSASLVDSGEIFQGPSAERTLVFKRVFTNMGDGYCPDTGIFTAPVNGLYYFSFSTYGYNTHVMGAILLKNGIRQVSTYDNLSTDGSDSSSNAVVLQLVAGDKVHMELWENGQVFDNLNGHTTFSGFLLFPV